MGQYLIISWWAVAILCVFSIGVVASISLGMRNICKNLKEKIKERDQIIINYVAQERNRRVYAVLSVIVNFFTHHFGGSGEVSAHALKIITEKHKNKTLIGRNGIIGCPAYITFLDILSQRNPEDYARITAFQELLKEIYAYSYPGHMCETPERYINNMRRMLNFSLDECEEELERMS